MPGPAYEPKYFKDMEIIFAEDDRGGEAYFVKSGQVRLTKKIDGKMENLTTVVNAGIKTHHSPEQKYTTLTV